MTKPNSVDAASLHPIVTRLRSLSKGKRVFRVQHKTDKSYCIQFEEWEQIEAGEWWKSNREKEQYAGFELALVEIDSEQDRTMREAADMLEFFFGQMQMHSPKMDGRHSYRFHSGWPMTLLIGETPEKAVRVAMQDVQRWARS